MISGIAIIKRYALCGAQAIPHDLEELRKLDTFLATGRTHVKQTGADPQGPRDEMDMDVRFVQMGRP